MCIYVLNTTGRDRKNGVRCGRILKGGAEKPAFQGSPADPDPNDPTISGYLDVAVLAVGAIYRSERCDSTGKGLPISLVMMEPDTAPGYMKTYVHPFLKFSPLLNAI